MLYVKRRLAGFFAIFFLFDAVLGQSELEISLKHGNDREKQTKDQLQRLLKQYDLAKWIFTKKILIEFKVIPHSHPVLTINTRHLDDDPRFLSMFIHEQIHWFASNKYSQTSKAMEELKTIYPDAPDGPPEGARNKESTYLHLIVCYLEYDAMRELLGVEKAKKIMEESSKDFYKWIYRTVLSDGDRINAILAKNGLKI